MPRPLKCRKIDFKPDTLFFKPAGVPVSELEICSLTLDEVEAIRLADLEHLYQEQAAEKMNISRQTFGNIISSARGKIADALINGKAIKFEGGFVDMTERKFVCLQCKHEWKLPFGQENHSECPNCHSFNVHRSPDERGHAHQGNCHRSGKKHI